MEHGKAGNVTIIKRKKVIAAGHHGGAWKVAYADFVTAMMAFFLLMWLLSVTDDQTRLGLADYFSPTIPIHSSRGGGDGPFDGDSILSQDVLMRDETGKIGDPTVRDAPGATDQSLWDIERQLSGASGDAIEADPLLKHIATRVTDEGLIIEVFDIPGSSLFRPGTATPNRILERSLEMIGRVLARTANPIALTGHLASGDLGYRGTDSWGLSSDRARVSMQHLLRAGVAERRIARVTGKSNREPAASGRVDPRNRRIEIALLRTFDPAR